MPPAVVLILYALAVARTTTMITHDQITAPLRAWLIRRFNADHVTHRMAIYALGQADADEVGCPWCVSVWISAATAAPVWYWHHNPAVVIPMIGLAASQATGMLYQVGRN